MCEIQNLSVEEAKAQNRTEASSAKETLGVGITPIPPWALDYRIPPQNQPRYKAAVWSEIKAFEWEPITMFEN